MSEVNLIGFTDGVDVAAEEGDWKGSGENRG